MMKLVRLAILLLFSANAAAQTTDSLRVKIQQIVSGKKAVVGVSIIGNNGKDTLSLNGERHYPLQSVFKYHIALAVLAEVDKGRFTLHQKIKIRESELLPGLYSPLREDYPQGAILPLSKILSYTVSMSDNVGCDVLLRLVGGPKAVEAFFRKNHIDDVSIKFSEEEQQGAWDLQFQNWTTPAAASGALAKFYYNTEKLLSKKSHAFIWKIMRETTTGENRLRGQLPKNTVVAHKTGSSGTNKDGLTTAVNDMGIVFLPGGQHFIISVFVTNSTEEAAANEKIIADIAKAAWDYFIKKKP